MEQVNTALSVGPGDYKVTLRVPLPLPHRAWLPYDFLGGSVYTIPIAIADPAGIPDTFGVTYDGNGAERGSVPIDAAVYGEGDHVTVLGNEEAQPLIKANHAFVGWNTQSDGNGTSYHAADTFAIAANTTLYAQWEAHGVPGIEVPGGGGQGSTQPTALLPPTSDGMPMLGSLAVLLGLGVVGLMVSGRALILKKRSPHRS